MANVKMWLSVYMKRFGDNLGLVDIIAAAKVVKLHLIFRDKLRHILYPNSQMF